MNWLKRQFNYDAKCTSVIEKYIKQYCGGGYKRLLAKLKFNRFRKHNSCFIHPKASFGKNIYIAHLNNIIIGETSVLGDNISIYPGVKLITKVTNNKTVGEGNRRHPLIEDNCILCADCKIIGNVTVGKNSIIGAGAIVTKDVPENSVVVNVNEIRVNHNDNRELQKETVKVNNYKCLFYDEKLLNG